MPAGRKGGEAQSTEISVGGVIRKLISHPKSFKAPSVGSTHSFGWPEVRKEAHKERAGLSMTIKPGTKPHQEGPLPALRLARICDTLTVYLFFKMDAFIPPLTLWKRVS